MKKLFTITLLIFVSYLTYGQIPTNGLVAYYPFTGNANNLIQNSNNGTVKGATLTNDRFGNPNSAYKFDGLSNYISLNKLNLFNSNIFTFSLWFKVKQRNDKIKDNYSKIFATYPNNLLSNDFNYGKGIGINKWDKDTTLITYEYHNDFKTNSKINLDTSSWHHIVVVYNKNVISTYLDNNKLEDVYYTQNLTSADSILVGKHNDGTLWGTRRFFKGEVDDIRFYNTNLSETDIANLYFTEGGNQNCIKLISVTDTLKIGRITGLNTLPDNFGLVKVYPNPAKDVLNISVSNPTASYSIQITNQLGQVLYTNSLSNSSLQVNVNSIGANGLYFIKILDLSNNVLDTRKLVLE